MGSGASNNRQSVPQKAPEESLDDDEGSMESDGNQESPSEESNPAAEKIARYFPGMNVAVLDIYTSKTHQRRVQKWRMATILEVYPTHSMIRIHFDGWDTKWDINLHVIDEDFRIHILTDPTDDLMPESREGIERCINKKLRSTDQPVLTRSTSAASHTHPGLSNNQEQTSCYQNKRYDPKNHQKAGSEELSLYTEHVSKPMPLRKVQTEWARSPRLQGYGGGRGRRGPNDSSQGPNLQGQIGLVNLGNTCFINSTVQCLSSLYPLTHFFISGQYKHDLSGKGKLQGELSNEFANIMQKLWSNPTDERYGGGEYYPSEVVPTVCNPSIFKKYLGSLSSKYREFEQHDAQEFLRFLLDELHVELNRITRAPEYEEIIEKPHEAIDVQSRRWWDNFHTRNDSLVTDIFCGQLWSQITCQKCKTKSNTFDPFFDLSLPIPQHRHSSRPKSSTRNRRQGDTVHLTDCLQSFLTSETLSGSNQYRCAKCKTFRDCEKKMTLYRFPQTLCMHLKRFSHRHNRSSKVDTNVIFPLTLDLTDLCSLEARREPVNQQAGFKYRLVAMCLHSGTVNGGHYMADCNRCSNAFADGSCFMTGSGHPADDPNSKWYRFNDSSVSRLPNFEENFDTRNAYILFYDKIT